MPYVHIVLALALGEFFLFCLAVARARATYRVPAPAIVGHEVFERYFRVQMNTLEQLVIFVPSIILFGAYVLGFMLSLVPNLTLLGGGLLGAAWQVLRPALG